MRLLDSSSFEICEFYGTSIPEYAILSHRWEDEEVKITDLTSGEGKALKGWRKIEQFCSLTARHGIKYAWVDTCCIDKSSSAELQEAINSMYSWYERARTCIVFMSDVCSRGNSSEDLRSAFRKSLWFSRGWTLQELLAPSSVVFYDCEWLQIGTRDSLKEDILSATGIASDEFKNHRRLSVAKRMSWASQRRTTREEDMAYCLLGLFDVKMPLLYGEGKTAFLRLQLEIIAKTNDESIFAWMRDGTPSGLLASSPADFGNSRDVQRLQWLYRKPYKMTNSGLSISCVMSSYFPDGLQGVLYHIVPLNCSRKGLDTPLCIFLALHRNGGSGNDKKDPDRNQAQRLGPLSETYKISLEGGSLPGPQGKEEGERRLYIRQEQELNSSTSYLFSGFHDSYWPPQSRTGLHRRMRLPSPVWCIDDAKLNEEHMWFWIRWQNERDSRTPLTVDPLNISEEDYRHLTSGLLKSRENRNNKHLPVTLSALQNLFESQQRKKADSDLSDEVLSGFPELRRWDLIKSNEESPQKHLKCDMDPNFGNEVPWHAREERLNEALGLMRRYPTGKGAYSKRVSFFPLAAAAAFGHLEAAKLLLDEAANVEIVEIGSMSPVLLVPEEMKPDDKFSPGRTALSFASEYGHTPMVELLVGLKDVDVNLQDDFGRTPLWFAARNGHRDTVELLINYSADPLSCSHDGQTTLHVAARSGNVDMLAFIIPFHTDVSTQDKRGDTILSYAASSASMAMVERVLPYSNITTNDNAAWSPLHWACRGGAPEILKVLTDSGLEAHIVRTTEPEGLWTPLDIALFHENHELFTFGNRPVGKIPLALRQIGLTSDTGRSNMSTRVVCECCHWKIFGDIYQCTTCYQFRYCFMCKLTAHQTHPGHEWGVVTLGSPAP